MKNYLNTFTKKSKLTNTEKTLNQELNFMAADDVHRIALRNPTLYQTKSVPRVSGLSMGHSGSSGMA